MLLSRRHEAIPYYSAPGVGPDKRIILISYHAPPSNAVGSRRWVGMAKHFQARGWGFDIIAVDPSQLESRNDASLAELPAGTRLFAVPEDVALTDRALRILVLIRRRIRYLVGRPSKERQESDGSLAHDRPPSTWRAIDDFHLGRALAAESRWAKKAVGLGRRLVDPSVHRWVISSGPPHMAHEAARQISRLTGLPFVADFRDPWRLHTWESTRGTWHRRVTEVETRVVRESSLTLTNTDAVRSLMRGAYPTANIITITNGIDEEATPLRVQGSRFLIGYLGSIYFGRDPAPLFEAVARLVEEFTLSPDDIGLEFMGYFDPEVTNRLLAMAAANAIEPYVTVHQGRSRPEAMEFMSSCSVLVALQQGTDFAIPAKLYEIMMFPAWLLVIAGLHGATARLLEGTSADVLAPGDHVGIHLALRRHFEEFRNGRLPAPIGSQERFSRRYQASLLLDAMTAIVPEAHTSYPTT